MILLGYLLGRRSRRGPSQVVSWLLTAFVVLVLVYLGPVGWALLVALVAVLVAAEIAARAKGGGHTTDRR